MIQPRATLVATARHHLFLAAAAVALLHASALAAGPPDLVPASLLGPQQVSVATQVPVHFTVANLGGPLVGSYTAEVVLSADDLIDGSDPVVGSLTTSFLGQHSILASIPPDQPWGSYHFGLRILGALDEADGTNNDLLGLAVEVIQVDLALADPAPVVALVRSNDVAAPMPEVVVENAGSPGTILVYQATLLSPAPWLTLDPPENFAIAGQAPNPNRLILNHAGLAKGSYQTTVRYQNSQFAEDFQDLSVTLVVGDGKFDTGDRIQGQVSQPGEVDEIVFDGLAGMKVPFSVKSSSGDLLPVLTLVDPDGVVETSLSYKHGKGYQKKTVKLKQSGEYRLLVAGAGATTGDYKIKTSRSMPAKAKAYSATLGVGESMVSLILGGATLDVSANPGPIFAGPLVLTLMGPTGMAIDVGANTTQEPGGELVAKGIAVATAGAYRIEAAGFGGAGETVTIHVAPVQPKLGKSKIYLD